MLYEQLAFGDVAGDAGEDQDHGQDDDQEREFAISPESRSGCKRSSTASASSRGTPQDEAEGEEATRRDHGDAAAPPPLPGTPTECPQPRPMASVQTAT